MDDETFFAWLDGELDADRSRAVEAEVRASPELTSKAKAHRALGARISAAFDPVAASPLPTALQATIAPPKVVDLADARDRRRSWPGSFWQNVTALAASLAIGLFAGSMFGGGSGPVQEEAGQLVAANALAAALDTSLASAPTKQGPRIGLTFRAVDGHVCRSFTAEMGSGLACRDGDRWSIRGLFRSPEGQDAGYRMAAGTDPQLAGLIETTIAGDPFDAAAERRARDSSWR